MQLQTTRSSGKQMTPVAISMVPKTSSDIQGQSQIFYQTTNYMYAIRIKQPTHVLQATNFECHPSQGYANLNPALHNNDLQQNTHGHR